MLDKQVQILSVDTGDFYSKREARLHWCNQRVRSEKNVLVNRMNEIEEELKENGITDYHLNLLKSENVDGEEVCDKFWISIIEDENLFELCSEYSNLNFIIDKKNSVIKKSKEKLLKLLSNKIQANMTSNGTHHIRELDENSISEKNIISVFDSSFIRMMGISQDEFTDNFMVVQVYYFDVIKDLIYYGFTYKGEKYIYFTSSAGQIRTKKAVFVKEEIWDKYEKTIMCGLTIDDINAKGGNNPNKHLAYMALSNSATDNWEGFDIDKTIVIDDFETNVYGTYDLIDDEDYSIKRVNGFVPITHTDGAGMILKGKNRMVRLPWIKGLLGNFDYIKFIKVNNCSPVIKDVYGKEHDIIKEDIQIIFTKSQFKMWKYYDSWEQYKEYFKKYNCTAGFTNMEEDRIGDATINYQMLQTLTDVTDEEIEEIAKSSIDRLNNLCKSVDTIKSAFGVTPYNVNKTYLQKAIELYPNLLNDEYLKNTLREIKDSMVKRYKSGKLNVNGKYTFLLPDYYAACEYWFLGEENPNGLLSDKEVFCWLFRKNEKLDCLRSPHLFKEHAIRFNMAYSGFPEKKDRIREWFKTDAVYTSCHDLISKILQFDVDGDKSLVVADDIFISVAERNMKNIVPLYYNMKKAEAVYLDNKSVYDGLNAAFVGGNIGFYSNNITKIWNSEVFINGTEEEKQEATNVIKYLCMENNFVIDYAKTLYKPRRPEKINKLITLFTKAKVPYFFIYAKDKSEFQVEGINGSLVNKLNNLIPNPRINCRKAGIGTIDYKLLMNNPDIEVKVAFDERGRIDKDNTDPLILKYIELNQKYHFKINFTDNDLANDYRVVVSKSQIKNDLFFKKIAKEIKCELLKFGYTEIEVSDILIKYLYGIKKSKSKEALWFCYGEYIYQNIKNNTTILPVEDKPIKTKAIQCVDCGKWFDIDVKNKRTCRCDSCQKEYTRKIKTEKQRNYRIK